MKHVSENCLAGLKRYCVLIALAVVLTQTGSVAAQSPGIAVEGDIVPVHDPAIILDDRGAHLFTTSHVGEGPGLIHWRTSSDLKKWSLESAVFREMPAWAKEYNPDTRGLWAPDIIRTEDEYRLYYSVSSFGQNLSAIGMATASDLDPDSEEPVWEDQGFVIGSTRSDDYNAIDPNYLIDNEGRHWLSFGSFWTGLKMVELDPASGKPFSDDPEIYDIARKPSMPGDIEAPFIIEREGWYYMFASKGFCCRGENSTYFTVVGRSENPTGPYVDREGQDMMNGGGLTVLHADLDPEERFAGPGHPAILKTGETYLIVYHAYDTGNGGAPTLRIQPLEWSPDGWPVAM